MTEFSPGLILILGALLVPVFRGYLRAAYMLALPVAAFALTLTLSHGDYGQLHFFGLTLTTLRVDGLSLAFAYVFLLAALLGIIYALHVDDTLQQIASLVYAGSAVAALFAGDLLTLFVFWEGTTVGSVILVFAARNPRSFSAGMHYLVVQIVSGVLLLCGAALQYVETGSIAFELFSLETTAGVLIFVAFGIKCAFPLVHNWLAESYPAATATGAVFLSAFTTKLAIYALARSYPGTELLVPIGATMALFPIFYAVIENDLRRVLAFALISQLVIENDLRRVLAFALISQLGFMVVGVGIGTDLSLNGAVAHAFCSIVYKALLFMAMGAVLLRTGSARATELGGIFRSMPWTTAFCLVGAASLAAFPLFSGFVSKAMIVSAAMKEGYFWTWLALLAGGVGVFVATAVKVPYQAFFGPDSGKRPAEAPANMLTAMALGAVACVLIGVFPSAFYSLLPFGAGYVPYTVEHVITQLQLLMFAGLGFAVLVRVGLYPSARRSINLDFDWFYRHLLFDAARWGVDLCLGVRARCLGVLNRQLSRFMSELYRHHGPTGLLARTWPTGSMAFWTTVLLVGYLVFYFL